MQKNKRYEWDKMEGCEWIRDTEMVNQPLYYDLETVASLLNQQDKRIKELEKENQQFKQQLEKTKQTGSYQVMLMCQKENILLRQQLKQSQKQLAIEELEKVKELGFIQSYTLDVPNILILKYEDFKQLLDNQIKKLKGEEK